MFEATLDWEEALLGRADDPLSMAQFDKRRAMIEAYTLYKVFWRAMGFQLSRLFTLSPLLIRIVIDLFHEGGILALTQHVFRMVVMMACLGSSFFQAAYGRRSGPGAELAFVCFNMPVTSSLEMGVSRRSVGVTSCHNWVGGGLMGMFGSTDICLARK